MHIDNHKVNIVLLIIIAIGPRLSEPVLWHGGRRRRRPWLALGWGKLPGPKWPNTGKLPAKYSTSNST
jgi:hypothetical protein